MSLGGGGASEARPCYLRYLKRYKDAVKIKVSRISVGNNDLNVQFFDILSRLASRGQNKISVFQFSALTFLFLEIERCGQKQKSSIFKGLYTLFSSLF